MRMRGRVDNTHREVIDTLRQLGFSVLNTAPLGSGAPDLVAARRGRNYMIEVKSGPIGYKLTKDQKAFHNSWNADVHILTGRESVVKWVNLLENQYP